MFWFISGKKRVEEVKEETKKGFDSVKKDLLATSEWIKHLDSEKNLNKQDILNLKEDLSNIKEEIENLKNVFSLTQGVQKNTAFKQPFKTNRGLLEKQTGVGPVQTGVQTGVQTPNLGQFSLSERVILLSLLNSDMKLSYDDLAAMLGKEKSTIRGQINTIKSKSEGLISEQIEQNGKKRVYIPSQIKEKMLKKQKVRVNSSKKTQKNVKEV